MVGPTDDGCEVGGVNSRSTTSMHGHGKSARPIVPRKPANKGGDQPLPAEQVEGRGLAKGNQIQPNRHRARDRMGADMANAKRARSGKPRRQPSGWTYVSPEDLQQALDRIRTAVARDKDPTSLPEGVCIVMTRGRSPVR